ncbi:MAG: hypothetical protein RLN88_09490 [Ekhidna sp.]|uniref:hypothetical protein n=1 Tax=Ekhidna sp. TaxID=2608089 RepID=UPI0032EE56DF
MTAPSVKQSLHEIIDKIEDTELLSLHLKLLLKETQKDFFNTSDDEMIARAEQSLVSAKEGQTRSIKSFKEEVNQWKKNQVI